MAAETASRHLSVLWLASLLVPATIQLGLIVLFPGNAVFDSPHLLFWVVILAASLCAVLAVALLLRAWQTDEAELGYTSLFFFSVSILPLVHGITTPGALFDENTTSAAAMMLAIPTGVVGAGPLLARRLTLPHRLWRHWAIGFVACVSVLVIGLLAYPDLLAIPAPLSPTSALVVTISLAGCTALSRRHLHLARIARSPGPLAVSLGYGLVGASSLLRLGAEPYSSGFWVAHIFDALGVMSALTAALVVYRRTDDVRAVLGPVLATRPIAALELGLEPIVHRFVGALDAKDQITRDHVVRTAELTIQVAAELGLDDDAQRRIGLAGLLHDVGKLQIPDEVLKKPGRLTDDEFTLIKTHVVLGEELVQSSDLLDEIGPAVRSHHERFDGGGYPDGLAGPAITIDARIVAACDAFDAMTNTRQYRQGMGQERSIAILREHAGSQWDPDVVEALIRIVERRPPSAEPHLLADAGAIGCDCLHDLSIPNARVAHTTEPSGPEPSGSDGLVPGPGIVPGFAGQPEHALTDDVALHLGTA